MDKQLSKNARQEEILLAKSSRCIQPTSCHCLSAHHSRSCRLSGPRPDPGGLHPTTIPSSRPEKIVEIFGEGAEVVFKVKERRWT